jgi:DNA-binding MarR family transcriptional regulator
MRKAERSETGKPATRGRDVAAASGTAVIYGRKPRASAAGGPAALRPALASAALSQPALSQRSVWYRLMKLTNLINRPFFSRYAERYHLTINDSRVLVTLASASEAAAHELCEATGMHPMNVSRSVATLRRQGRITERRDPANRRRKMLRLTPKGWSTCRSFVPDMERMSKFLLASMSPLEVEFFGRLVDQLIARLETIDSRSGLPAEGATAEPAARELDGAAPPGEN